MAGSINSIGLEPSELIRVVSIIGITFRRGRQETPQKQNKKSVSQSILSAKEDKTDVGENNIGSNDNILDIYGSTQDYLAIQKLFSDNKSRKYQLSAYRQSIKKERNTGENLNICI